MDKLKGLISECVGQAKILAEWLSEGIKLPPQWIFVISTAAILLGLWLLGVLRSRRAGGGK